MKKYPFIPLFSIPCLGVHGQPPERFFYGNSIPVFRPAKDSIMLAEADKLLKLEIKHIPQDEEKIDNLQEHRIKIYDEAVIGYQRFLSLRGILYQVTVWKN